MVVSHTSFSQCIPSIAPVGVTKLDPSNCGEADGEIVITELQNVIEYIIEYKKNGESQPIQRFFSSTAGEIKIEGLSGGTYSDFILTPQSGNICPATGGSLEVVLSEPGAPSFPAISGIKDYCEGEPIAPLTATGSGGVIEWYSDATFDKQDSIRV